MGWRILHSALVIQDHEAALVRALYIHDADNTCRDLVYDMRLALEESLGDGKSDLEWEEPFEYQLKDTFTSMKDEPLVQFQPRAT